MEYTVKLLTLYKDLPYSTKKNTNTDRHNSLYRYTCAVQRNDFNPQRAKFLTDPIFLGYALPTAEMQKGQGISAGRYFFLQGIFSDDEKTAAYKQRRACLRAAEYLYVESLWREIEFEDDTVYLRKLEEHNKTVFQLFRKIAENGTRLQTGISF